MSFTNLKIVPDIIEDQKYVSVSATLTVREVAQIMTKHHFGALMVTKNDKLEGIVSERDITMKVVSQGRDAEKMKVSQIMTKNPETARSEDSALSALEKMHDRGFRHLPIVDGDIIIGIVSIRDLYAAAKRQLEDDVKNRDEFIFGAGYGG